MTAKGLIALAAAMMVFAQMHAAHAFTRNEANRCADEDTPPKARVEVCTKVLKTAKRDVVKAVMFYNRGMAHFDLGQNKKALADYNQVAALKSLSGPWRRAWLHYYRAQVYQALGQNRLALKDYDAAIRLNSDKVNFFLQRADLHSALGEDALAKKDYLAATKKMPFDANGYYKRGEAYTGLRDYKKAIKDFGEAVYLKPDFTYAYVMRCWARSMLGTVPDKAIADCNKAISLSPDDPDMKDGLGFAEYKAGHYTAAIADYTAALAHNPKRSSSLYLRGLAELKSGDGAGGRADIAAAKAIQPNIAKEYKGYGVEPPQP